ncbi:HNH endonuclease, partial [Clostridium sp.]|uniref:HNH endonuclease n=1 Tax=Clostridium sp. TaxID=1506 RepID=UPI003464B1CF
MIYCQICGGENGEVHHIIFRSKASYLSNVKINFKYLCSKCHRGKKGPHFSKEVDFKFKRELQDQLYNIFKDKRYYKEEEIKYILDISSSEALRILRP